LLDVNPGFNPANVLTFEVQLPNLPPARYERKEEQTAFFQQLTARLQSLPGVESAGGVLSLPLSGASESTDLLMEGQESMGAGERPSADYTMVTPGYFATLQIPLLQGRQFSEQDKLDAPFVIVINDTLAERIWPGQNPIGKRLRVGF